MVMEPNGLPAGMFSNMGSGMLGLEMSLHHHQQNHHHLPPPQQQHPMVSFGHHEAADHHPQAHQSAKQSYPFSSKGKPQQLTLSDDEDAGGGGPEDSGGDGKRKMSPWQRMKWTDSMVRLLIMVVFYIGDEVGTEGNEPAATAAAGKKKSGGVLQKKGKWKSVSRAMLERGFYVSPQQCEDKFNDLNKRYKRVNDILGKGTACRVVENQSLLDSMDHLSPKMKDEVKKLLNSKHLFFREMCAYHNSCGGGNGGGAGAHHSPEMAAPAVAEGSQIQKQSCLHSSENNQIEIVGNLGSRAETEGSKSKSIKDLSDDDDDEGEDEDDSYDEEEVVEGRNRGHDLDEEDGNTHERFSRKRVRNGKFETNLTLIQQFNTELKSLVEDSSKSPYEKRLWMRNRMLKLEEQRVGYHYQAFEIEKQRVKWLKFSGKKEREMEAEKLTNERLKLENERMVLLLRQKEMDLADFQQLGNKRGDPPSSITG